MLLRGETTTLPGYVVLEEHNKGCSYLYLAKATLFLMCEVQCPALMRMWALPVRMRPRRTVI